MKIYSYAEKIVCKKCKHAFKPTAKICRKCKSSVFRLRKKLRTKK